MRGLPFEVDAEYLSHLYESQKGKCAISGLPIPLHLKVRGGLYGDASVDRIDNRLGYVRGNVQWVHKDINCMKSDMSLQSFIELCDAVAAHSRLGEKKPVPCTEHR
jgi:hypothetical protein